MSSATMTRGRATAAGWTAIAVLTLALSAAPAAAQGGALPADMQVALITKILRFDRHLERYGGDVVLGILYQAGSRETARAASELSDAARTVHGVGPAQQTFRTVLLPYRSGMDLRAELKRAGIALLYVSPMRAVDVKQLIEEADAAGVLTVSGDAEPIQSGVAIALQARGPRPAVSIRLGSARKAGSDFDSRLLALVDVQP